MAKIFIGKTVEDDRYVDKETNKKKDYCKILVEKYVEVSYR